MLGYRAVVNWRRHIRRGVHGHHAIETVWLTLCVWEVILVSSHLKDQKSLVDWSTRQNSLVHLKSGFALRFWCIIVKTVGVTGKRLFWLKKFSRRLWRSGFRRPIQILNNRFDIHWKVKRSFDKTDKTFQNCVKYTAYLNCIEFKVKTWLNIRGWNGGSVRTTVFASKHIFSASNSKWKRASIYAAKTGKISKR